jgi:hypothetical protein
MQNSNIRVYLFQKRADVKIILPEKHPHVRPFSFCLMFMKFVESLSMKIVRTTIIALTVIVAAFFGIGLIIPSYEYQSFIEVNATPEKCWAIYHDTNRMNEWLKGFESLTLKNGDSLAAGSTYEIVVTDDGHRMVMNEKIIDVTAPTRVSYELTNDVLKSEFSFSFEGTTSTRITSKYKITGNNILWKSILFLSKSYMTSSGQEQLEELKKIIEKQ